MFGADKQNEQSASNVAEQERFAEAMASTQYQRGVKDLQAAGLNPMLAYMNSAAPSPQGSVAPVQNTMGPLSQGIQNGISTALDGQRLQNENKSTDANVKLATQNANLAEVKTNTESANAISAMEGARLSSDQRALFESTMDNRFATANQRAKNEYNQSVLDSKTQTFDHYNNRVRSAMGTVNSALDAAKPFSSGSGAGAGYQDEFYDRGGEFSGMRERTYK